MRIKQVSITGVRGIPALTLDIQGKNVVIYGENGSGKSSIVDALEFFFTGEVSHLDGVQDISFRQHCHNINSRYEDMRVEVTLNAGPQSITRTTKGFIGVPDSLREELAFLKASTFVLRRSQILNFIANQPAGKYEALAQLIGVKKLDDISLVFQRVRAYFEKEASSRNEEKGRHLRELSNKLRGTVCRVEDAFPLLNIELEKAGFRTITSSDELDNFFASNRVKEHELRVPPEVAAVNQLLGSIPDRIVLPETIMRLNELKGRLASLVVADITWSVQVSNLLEVGMEILYTSGDERCPLCGQDIDLDTLLLKLEERAKLVKSSKEEFDSIVTLAAAVSKEMNGALNRLDNLLKEGRKHEGFSKWISTLEAAERTLSEYKEAIDTVHQGPIALNLDDLVAVDGSLQATMREIRDSMHALVQKVAPSPEELFRYDTLVLVGEVIEKVKAVGRSEEEAARLARAYEVSDRIFKTYVECKNEVVQGVFDSIQADIARFYLILHPGEQPNNINLEVNKNKRASADLSIDYFDRTIDPRAYLSEGHLDSLGLCILMAFIKKYNRDCPIIILDDIVTTIDAGHRERLCELVYSEFKGTQVFITTHDGIWKEQLVNYDRTYGANSMCLEIVDYSPALGPVIQQAKPSWERITKRLAEGDKAGAGNEGRRYLEEVLENICVLLRASLTYKGCSYHYNVQELLDAARKRAESKIEKTYFDAEVLPKFHALSSNKFLANLASHNNKEIAEVSVDELRRFCDAARALDRAFVCRSCEKRLLYSEEYKLLYCTNPNCTNHSKINLK